MAFQFHFFILFASFVLITAQDKQRLTSFIVSWLDDKHTFNAGDIATIKIEIVDNFDTSTHRYADRFTLSVNGKKGNSSYVSGVASSLEPNATNWNITFIPILAGQFPVTVNDSLFGVLDSTLHFNVVAGPLHPSVCITSWMNPVNEFVAGTRANVLILPKDAFGNNISSTSLGSDSNKFMVSAFYENGSIASVMNVTHIGWNEFGYIVIEFIVVVAGNLSLHVEVENQALNSSPLPFKVKPGSLDISNCLAKWKYETNALQIFSKLEIFIHQQDRYGNLVPGLCTFDAQVVEKETNLSIPVADLSFHEVAEGIQLFSFLASEPGEFILTIFNMKQNESISNMPYDYTVFVGYCDGLNSVVNGSGLAGSVAGQIAYFSVYLEDRYHNPSPVEAEKVHVQITRKIDSYSVRATILPMRFVEGRWPTGEHNYNDRGYVGNIPALSLDLKNTSATNPKVQDSAFSVIYTPEKSGSYEIWVFCGNIPLNNGRPYTKEVFPGSVDTTLSNVVQYIPNVAELVRNEVVVQLVDSFYNPVLSQETNLSYDFGLRNNSGFSSWMFEDNGNGSYVGYYLARDLGTFEICISFEGKHLSHCPIEVNVRKRQFFPRAYNDTFSVWEDESVALDVLKNDYLADGIARIIASSQPRHGSLLQYVRLFRYTPFKGFYGNDSFSYMIADINENVVSGTVMISVLSNPPQFVSLPALLQATEDVICPRFGGFPGFEIRYSDAMENISVTLSTQFGTVFLSPMQMQFSQPLGSGLSVGKEERSKKDLILVGRVEVINSALQSIQYLGNENFYGNDVISLSTRNKNGFHEAHVPIFVEPINDPPYIRIPKYIILDKGAKDGSQIFKKHKDMLEFSIWDPDLLNFPGNKSQFVVTFSVEVNVGIIITNLHVDLIPTTELKLQNSYQWQPLLTFVTISNHFVVKGKGVRFLGTVKDCNNAMQQLVYRGAEHGAVLTISVNDMGNYGCYPDCIENMSFPLFTQITVNLIKQRPMSSLVAHSLGSAIILEFIMMLFLGAVLLFFICKCAIALGKERRNRHSGDAKLSEAENFGKSTLNASSSENVTYFTGCSSPFLLRSHHSNFRQRSRQQSSHEGSGKDGYHSSPFSSDNSKPIPVPPAIVKPEKETA